MCVNVYWGEKNGNSALFLYRDLSTRISLCESPLKLGVYVGGWRRTGRAFVSIHTCPKYLKKLAAHSLLMMMTIVLRSET